MQSLKGRAQTMLKRAGLYHRLRTSSIHDLYRCVADRSWILARDKHLDFYRRLLPELRRGDLIFDVGANEGLKADLFLRLGARVIAIEPDETNQAILRERFLKLRPARKPVVIVGKAVSDSDGVGSMWIDGPGSAVNTLSQKWATTLRGNKARHTNGHCGLDFVQHRTVETTTLEELIAMHGRPLFVKIDVEGFEPNVLIGAAKLISKFRAVVVCEVQYNTLIRNGFSADNVLSFLVEHGYEIQESFTDPRSNKGEHYLYDVIATPK